MKTLQAPIYFLAVALTLAPVTSLAHNEAEANRPLPSAAPLLRSPIGSVVSLESVAINGNGAGRQGLLWNGDVVQAAPGASAQVQLTAIGQVTVRGGSAVKLTADAQQHLLLASVLSGDMSVSLKSDTAAKIEIGGAGFVTTKGAQVRVTTQAGQPVVIASVGQALPVGNYALGLYDRATAEAAQQQAAPRKYLIKPLNLGTNTEIRARSTRNIQVRVTDENDRPVPDAPVLFLLGAGGAGGAGGGGNAGSLAGQASMRATTNSQGVAEVNFTANDATGSSTRIRVQVEGSEAVWEGTLNIIAAKAGFWAPQNAVPIFSIVAAGAGIGIYKALNRDPVRETPQVTPRTNGTSVVP